MNTLEAAQSWTKAGFSVIPIGWRSKRPSFDALRWTGCTTDTEAGPQPAWEMFKQRVPTWPELKQLFAGPRRNLGVVTGYNNLVVLDFDQMDAYEAWACWAKAEGSQAGRMLAGTYRVYSARGVHLYMIVDEPVESYKAPGIDVKARWGYVLAPPSVHPSGHVYRAEGTQILRCEKLSEVFPFEKTMMASMSATTEVYHTDDPYEAATRSVESCEKGTIDKIKASVMTVNLVNPTSQDARGAWALCPLHDDKEPSLRIYPDGTFYCFGCQKRGDVIDMYAALNQLTNREAIAELANR